MNELSSSNLGFSNLGFSNLGFSNLLSNLDGVRAGTTERAVYFVAPNGRFEQTISVSGYRRNS